MIVEGKSKQKLKCLIRNISQICLVQEVLTIKQIEDVGFLNFIYLSKDQPFYHLLLSPNIDMLGDVIYSGLDFQIQIIENKKRGERTQKHEVLRSSSRV